MTRNYMRQNLPTVSVLLFIALYYSLLMFKPHFLYNKDGSLRTFGIGFRKKTVVPAWLVSILLAIISYLAVLYYITFPRIS